MTPAEPQRRKWTVDEYHRAADAGIFRPEERLELIDGEIIRQCPQHSLHAAACDLCEEALRAAFGPGFVVRGQKPLALGLTSEPEPDVYVVAGRIRDLTAAHPSTALLVVEVADSSARLDLGRKAALYAQGGIADYWVVLLSERAVVVHREPDTESGRYRDVKRIGVDGMVSPLAASVSSIAVADLLP